MFTFFPNNDKERRIVLSPNHLCSITCLPDLFELFQKIFILRYAFLYVPDDAFFVDKIGDPLAAVKRPHLSVCIREKRKGELVLLAEFLVSIEAVRAHTQHLGVEAFEVRDVLLERLYLVCSDRREILHIEG